MRDLRNFRPDTPPKIIFLIWANSYNGIGSGSEEKVTLDLAQRIIQYKKKILNNIENLKMLLIMMVIVLITM